MVDKKTKFVLSLQGKENRGHLSQWVITDGELVGLNDIHYQLIGRANNYKIIDNEYATNKHAYYTLGEKLKTHAEIIEIYKGTE